MHSCRHFYIYYSWCALTFLYLWFVVINFGTFSANIHFKYLFCFILSLFSLYSNNAYIYTLWETVPCFFSTVLSFCKSFFSLILVWGVSDDLSSSTHSFLCFVQSTSESIKTFLLQRFYFLVFPFDSFLEMPTLC